MYIQCIYPKFLLPLRSHEALFLLGGRLGLEAGPHLGFLAVHFALLTVIANTG